MENQALNNRGFNGKSCLHKYPGSKNMVENEKLSIDLPQDIDDTVRILQLVTGTVDGKAFWAYLAMRPTTYQDYVARVEAGEAVDLEEYGDMLEQGWGTEPPAEVKQKMAREYGAEENFEEQLLALVEEGQSAE